MDTRSEHEDTQDVLSFTGAQWKAIEVDPSRVAALVEMTGLSPMAAHCLGNRLSDVSASKSWLSADETAFYDPFKMQNMSAAVERLHRGIQAGEKIRIITDYDVDGTTSSLILQAALRCLDPNVRVDYHLPNRFKEGYGFSVLAAETAADEGVDLIVTADIGVRDHEAVNKAHARGVDVLICDHHLPEGAEVPENACVLCPPQEGCDYPNASLAACGVSLKLAQALLQDDPRWAKIQRSLLKLAAIGTIADLVSILTPENRGIVRLGLEALNQDTHQAGLSALLQVCGLQPGNIVASDVSFRIAPRINAAGRLADADLVIRLLNCREQVLARQLAKQLDRINTERRLVQDRVLREAVKGIPEPLPPFLLLSGEETQGWHRGVVGIVASKIKDETHRTVGVVSIQGDVAVGSIRSTPGMNAVALLDSAKDLLIRYGGHPAAAGFSVRTTDLPALKERLIHFAGASQKLGDIVPQRQYDVEMAASELTKESLEQIRRLAPFGKENRNPTIFLRNVHPQDIITRGKAMVKFNLQESGDANMECVWWGAKEFLPRLRDGQLDLLGRLQINIWQGRRTLQFQVIDARAATGLANASD